MRCSYSFLAFLALLSSPTAAEEPATPKKPNILLLFADDLGRYASAYSRPDRPDANSVISTPTFDRIAREGALFQNAFVSAPSCTPSRASLYTGRHFFRNGSHSQLHSPWERGAQDPFSAVLGMPNQLAAAGYHVGWSHKWHMRTSLIGGKQNNYSTYGNRISRYSQVVSAAANPQRMKSRVLQAVRKNFQDFLQKRTDDQPFFYSFNPTNTHRAWTPGSGKDLWGLDPDELRGKLPPFLPDNRVIREDFADYLGEAMAFDAACGVILEELEASGEMDDTLVCITGDHGAPGFPRGKCNVYDFGARVLLAMRWPKSIQQGRDVQAPVSLIDLAPTFLAAASLSPEKGCNGQSMLSAIGDSGKDSDLRGWALIGREAHVGPCRPGGLPYPTRAIRTDQYLYAVNLKPERWPVANPPLAVPFAPAMKGRGPRARRRMDVDHGPTLDWFKEHENDPQVLTSTAWELGFAMRPSEELYDLKSDPHQMTNLAGDADWISTKKKLHEQLFRELRENNDPRLTDAFDRLPYNIHMDKR